MQKYISSYLTIITSQNSALSPSWPTYIGLHCEHPIQKCFRHILHLTLQLFGSKILLDQKVCDIPLFCQKYQISRAKILKVEGCDFGFWSFTSKTRSQFEKIMKIPSDSHTTRGGQICPHVRFLNITRLRSKVISLGMFLLSIFPWVLVAS